MSQVHPQARTTPRTRGEIKASCASITVTAQRYDITVVTARKWRKRDDVQDRSHRPHKLCTTLMHYLWFCRVGGQAAHWSMLSALTEKA